MKLELLTPNPIFFFPPMWEMETLESVREVRRLRRFLGEMEGNLFWCSRAQGEERGISALSCMDLESAYSISQGHCKDDSFFLS